MARKIDQEKDLEILSYLKNHSYNETQEKFGTSPSQIARIKKRYQNEELDTLKNNGSEVSMKPEAIKIEQKPREEIKSTKLEINMDEISMLKSENNRLMNEREEFAKHIKKLERELNEKKNEVREKDRAIERLERGLQEQSEISHVSTGIEFSDLELKVIKKMLKSELSKWKKVPDRIDEINAMAGKLNIILD